jgi:hypothetical protein
LSFRSEPVAVPIAVAFAFLVVIPEGDLWLHLPVFLLSFRSEAEESAVAVALLIVHPRGGSAVAPVVARSFVVIPQRSGGICFFLCLCTSHPPQRKHTDTKKRCAPASPNLFSSGMQPFPPITTPSSPASHRSEEKKSGDLP